MTTERIRKLKDLQLNTKPSASSERARLSTEAYQKFSDQKPVIQKARMLEHILENMTIFIQEGELLAGNLTDKPRCAPVYPEYGAEWILDELEDIPVRKTDPMQIDEVDKAALREILPQWRGKSFDCFSIKVLPERTLFAEKSGAFTVGNRDCANGHVLPYYRKLLKTGYKGLIEECEVNLKNCDSTRDQKDFWEASLISLRAAIKFAHRYADLAEKMSAGTQDPLWKADLLTIAKNCRNVPENPASTFHEAVQMIWFCHLIISIESNGHGNSFARFDQYTGAYYDDDIKHDRINAERAREIIACLFLKATDVLKLRDAFYSEAFAGYPVWQNIIVGGQNADGSDATNEVSMLLLEANEDVQTSQPTASVRWHPKLNPQLFNKGIEMIQKGLSTPAFFNDNLVLPMLINKGYDPDEVWDWGIFGCVQPNVAGMSDGRPSVGYINGLKCVELVLNRGFDPLTGEQMGLDTGEPQNLKEFQEAVYAQMAYFIDMMCLGHIEVTKLHGIYHPTPFSSCMVHNCIEKGKSLQQGGAKYNESGTLFCGIANTADAIAAVDTLVFKEKRYTMEQLKQALSDNFADNEEMRLTLLNKAPKYGNDIDYVDNIATEIVHEYKRLMDKYRDNRGGRFVGDIESQSLNVCQGKCCGATPDGRHAYEALNDNCSPAMGRDVSGPTAAVLSVAKLDQIKMEDGCLFNLRFDPRSVHGQKGASVISGVIRTYFDNMGEHIQINVVDNNTLRAAQREPEKYRGLLVRVAGYMAYFTELDKAVQETIIARTAHQV